MYLILLCFLIACDITVPEYSLNLGTVNKEDATLASVIGHILDTHYSDCSLGIGMDHTEMGTQLQKVLIRNQDGRYWPMVLSRMTGFDWDHKDYKWIWRPDHLLSFRTQPPELRSTLVTGGKCTFNLILARNASTLPQLIMTTANSHMFRNVYDPVFIHVQDQTDHNPQRFLLQDPVRGISLKLMSHFNPNTSTLTVHNVCYCCKSGHDDLNPPISFSTTHSDHDLFSMPPRNMNGKKYVVGYIEIVYLEDARIRKKNNMHVTAIEEFFLILEEVFNFFTILAQPSLLNTELSPNGSLTGISHEIMSKKVDWQAGTLYSDIATRATLLSYPAMFLRTGLVTRTPRPDMKWYLIFQPFAPTLWLTLFLCLLFSSVALYFINRAQEEGRTPVLKVASRICHNMSNLMANLLEEPLEYTHDTPTMTFAAVYLFFSMVVSCLYRTKLVSFITFPQPEALPRSFHELYGSGMSWGSADFMVILFSILLEGVDNPLIHYIADHMVTLQTVLECMELTTTDNFACILPDYFYNRERDNFLDAQGNPQIVFFPEGNLEMYTGPSYGRDHVYYQDMDRVFQRLVEARAFDHLINMANYRTFIINFFRGSQENQRGYGGEKSTVLSFKKLSYVFCMWLIGLAAAGIGFAYEKCRKMKREDMNNEEFTGA